MRKNTARHWLHATLDLLPVILIPVFMIYSHRHDLSTDITITQDVYKDFYQGVKNGKPNGVEPNIDNWSFDDVSYYENGNTGLYIESTSDFYYISYIDSPYVDIGADNIYYFSFDILDFSHNGEFNFYFSPYAITEIEIVDIEVGKYSYYGTFDYSLPDSEIDFYGQGVFDLTTANYQFFNLTSIFGSGNEPTKEVFESYLTQDYYDFGSNQVKVGTIDVPAKNNDIMSVFMDSFNNSINKYFNMGNVFNMTSVYNWFNTNIFGGNAPVVIYSVWNIVLYEFVMDLLFLLYGLFMWFIDICKRLMERPLDSIK